MYTVVPKRGLIMIRLRGVVFQHLVRPEKALHCHSRVNDGAAGFTTGAAILLMA